jgi:hypothetical protein
MRRSTFDESDESQRTRIGVGRPLMRMIVSKPPTSLDGRSSNLRSPLRIARHAFNDPSRGTRRRSGQQQALAQSARIRPGRSRWRSNRLCQHRLSETARHPSMVWRRTRVRRRAMGCCRTGSPEIWSRRREGEDRLTRSNADGAERRQRQHGLCHGHFRLAQGSDMMGRHLPIHQRKLTFGIELEGGSSGLRLEHSPARPLARASGGPTLVEMKPSRFFRIENL